MTRGGKTILVIDDDEVIRSLVQKILNRAGYDTVLTCTGEEGLEELRCCPEEIHLVIVDHTLEGLSGADLVNALRSEVPDIPVIISSGENIDLANLPAGQRPHASILKKPYRVSDLNDAVMVALES